MALLAERRAFGLVDLPGFPNVRVYLDNRVAGQTNADGKLFLPNLDLMSIIESA